MSSLRACLTRRRSTSKGRAIQVDLTLPRDGTPPAPREAAEQEAEGGGDEGRSRAADQEAEDAARDGEGATTPADGVVEGRRPGGPPGSGKSMSWSDQARRPAATRRLTEALARFSETPVRRASSA